jgi:hypothetical protein
MRLDLNWSPSASSIAAGIEVNDQLPGVQPSNPTHTNPQAQASLEDHP